MDRECDALTNKIENFRCAREQQMASLRARLDYLPMTPTISDGTLERIVRAKHIVEYLLEAPTKSKWFFQDRAFLLPPRQRRFQRLNDLWRWMEGPRTPCLTSKAAFFPRRPSPAPVSVGAVHSRQKCDEHHTFASHLFADGIMIRASARHPEISWRNTIGANSFCHS
jgi:hypothetical protein